MANSFYKSSFTLSEEERLKSKVSNLYFIGVISKVAFAYMFS